MVDEKISGAVLPGAADGTAEPVAAASGGDAGGVAASGETAVGAVPAVDPPARPVTCEKCGMGLRDGDAVLHCAMDGCPLGGAVAAPMMGVALARPVGEVQAEARAATQQYRAFHSRG